MPCGLIAEVEVIKVVKVGEDGVERSGLRNAKIYGSITTCYGRTFGHTADDSSTEYPPIVLYKKLPRKHDRLTYGIPIELCRSLVCVPSYSSLLVTLDITLRERGAKENIVLKGSKEFNICGNFVTSPEFLSVGNICVKAKVNFFTSDQGGLDLEKEKNRESQLSHQQPVSASSICRSVSRTRRMTFNEQIQVLSVFVAHEGREKVDMYGTIAVDSSPGRHYIYKRGESCPESFPRNGKAASLEGLTSYEGDTFSMYVKLKDIAGHVEIDNCFMMYYHVYDHPGQWFDRPLCRILMGKHSFTAVNFIVFSSAVRATVKISVIAKDASASVPFVYGSIVAEYSNYEYSNNYQRKHWRIVLFEEENARCLTEDGEVPLSRNVVSVPEEDSSLIVDVDLHASLGTAGASSLDHFLGKVNIGDDEGQKIEGRTYDLVVSGKFRG
ncbi:uncharacterized protein [Spinacia oleracea]|uniref:DUF6598 domain-containing protein n=1 Tax=Spinacia oleracea TaxID=3562 RepID=A0ABM3R0P0_SPIOL|nr:uncharacterized protein LOC110780107 [Spinacia oleracea]XP_056689186.1 uncharacterized protein LOC110780107 [Spinacia oleracea]XP_056689187.1 uncharacterized protein LOC110780107 [Spinacia oleracea]